MTKYTVVFKNKTEVVFTSENFNNRLQVYNHVVNNGMAKANGGVKEITCSAYIK